MTTPPPPRAGRAPTVLGLVPPEFLRPLAAPRVPATPGELG
jgi:hypothetical protein